MAKPITAKKILFAGGGTLGPVTPLLAVAQALRADTPEMEMVWVGTPSGPERTLVEEAGMKFLYLPVARLTRYPSTEWVLLPLRLIQAIMTAWSVVRRERPSLIATAGGYTGVPVAWVGWWLGIPVWVHQPDVLPILSVRLIAPFATRITTAWQKTAKAFSVKKTRVIGNPVRPDIYAGAKDRAAERFAFDLTRPTVLVMGGGGGSAWINARIKDLLPEVLEQANVLHITGKGKKEDTHPPVPRRYKAIEQLTEGMADALALADVVVTRAGMGALAECAALQKAVVVIPLPHSPQEANAQEITAVDAGIVLRQATASMGDMKGSILGLIQSAKRREEYGRALHALLPTQARAAVDEIKGYIK